MSSPQIVELLQAVVSRNGSDLHLSVGAPPFARVHGSLVPLADQPLTREDSQQLVVGVLTDQQRAKLEETLELDFAVHVEGLGRFRGNAHYNRGSLEAAFRHIPDEIQNLPELGHEPVLEELCRLHRGLILVTGIAGSGKSTTLASMVKRISETRSGVIISVEDPIEFIFHHSRSLVKQREIGHDTLSFASALRHVLRQDPDVILVSELRDLETMQAAVTAAETGHLVLSTLHTIDAPKALDRMIDAFPPDQQGQIVAQLANCLQAVVSQRLLPRADGNGRVLASEVMIMNHGIRNCLRTRKYEQIYGLMEIGSQEGMHTIDESLQKLIQQDLIDSEAALSAARDRDAIQQALNDAEAAKAAANKKRGWGLR